MDQMARDGFKKRLDAEATPDTKDDEEVEGEERSSGGQAGFMPASDHELLPVLTGPRHRDGRQRSGSRPGRS